MSLRTRISGLEWDLECTSHGSSPKSRKRQKKALAKAERRLGKLELFSEICAIEPEIDAMATQIEWLRSSGAGYGCGCGCGGMLLKHLVDAKNAGFKSLDAYAAWRSDWELEIQKEDLWQGFYVREQQIRATSIALRISYQKAEALWEEVASS